ncbi:MAG: POTRA domain-containing protein [Terriglobia bacterium]
MAIPPQKSARSRLNSNSIPSEVSIRAVHLEGGGELPLAQTVVCKELRAHTYSLEWLAEISERARSLYQNSGFVRVEVSDPDITRLDSTTIDVTLRIRAGSQYCLKEVEISGAKTLAAVELRGLFPLQAGDVFNLGKVRNAFEAIRRLYQTRGYINFTASPDQKFDETGKTILLKVEVLEGKAFRFGPLKLSGVEVAPGVGQGILTDWNPYVGQGFNIEVLERFIEEHLLIPKARVAEFYGRHVELELNEREGIATILLLLPGNDLQ